MPNRFQLNDTQIGAAAPGMSKVVPLTPISEFPEESVRIDVTKTAQFVSDSVEQMLKFRAEIDIDWQKTRYILNGHHYFDVDTLRGTVSPSLPDEDTEEVQAYTNLMLNAYRWELGNRISAPINHLAIPRSTSTESASYMARRASAGLESWREESKFDIVWDRFNQLVLRLGLAALLPEPSWDGKSAVVHAIPGSDLFPLPGDATNTIDAAGVAYRKFLSKSWMEDNVKKGILPEQILAEVKDIGSSSPVGSPYAARDIAFGGRAKIKGAISLFFYIDPGPEYPSGAHGMIINKKIWAMHLDPQTGMPSLPIGGAPIIIKDTEFDSEWYPQSFLAPLIGLNLEDDRQFSNEIAVTEINRHGGWTLVPENAISMNDMQQKLGGYIPYQADKLGYDKRDPFYNIRPPQMGQESSLVGARVARESEDTTGHTNVRRGQHAGRVDSDVANQRLISMSDVPNNPFYKRTRSGLAECFNKVLDILAVTWPDDKWVQFTGPLGTPQEIQIKKGEMPTSKLVKIEVGALVPSNRNTTLQMLQLLRRDKDISPAEYRSAIVVNGLEPKGISLKDSDIEFARSKISFMYGDGQKGEEWPFEDDFELEPHGVMVHQLRLFMNTIPFKLHTDPSVKAILRREIFKHQQKLSGDPGRLRSQFGTEEFDRDRFDDRVTADEDRPGFDNNLLSDLTGAL